MTSATRCRVFIASDHGGFALKGAVAARLGELGHDVQDLGPDSAASVDYPSFAAALCRRVLAEPGSLGVLICGTGLGMSMAANRFPGIRAALCHNEFSARMARQHNDANVLCLGERVLGLGMALGIVDAFFAAEFEGARHKRRIDLIEELAMRP